MKLRWRDLQERPEGVHLQESVELPNIVKENRQVIKCEPFRSNLQASTETKGSAIVQGDLDSQAIYRCSRCLTDFSEALHVPFTEHFVQIAGDKPFAQDGEDDEDDRIQVVGDTIDLTPYLEQAVHLALPYRPLCKQDCAGLCPECGVNRNEENCSCNTERIDPRMADLKKFFENGS